MDGPERVSYWSDLVPPECVTLAQRSVTKKETRVKRYRYNILEVVRC